MLYTAGGSMDIDTYPHRRYNPLSGEWVLCSPHRTERPWQGHVEKPAPESRPEYDPACYLCPGNGRANGRVNPVYKDVFVFVNDFPALIETAPEASSNADDLFVKRTERGVCKVICFSPRHDLSFARMQTTSIKAVVDEWVNQFVELSGSEHIRYVQIFENRGIMMGCSNQHPHGQIWASSMIPDLPERETLHQRKYFEEHGRCLLCTYVEKELGLNERVIFENGSFVMLVPFWAVWPFEIMIVPKRHMAGIDEMAESERSALAEILKYAGIKLDNLFLTTFPYSMGVHQRPCMGKSYPEWHFHFHYFPPLLRSATVKKHMVGYELLCMPQRDMTPERAAELLRACPDIHYRDTDHA